MNMQLEIPFKENLTEKIFNKEYIKNLDKFKDKFEYKYSIDYLLIDDLIKNNTTKMYKIVDLDSNNEYMERFIEKPKSKKSFFNRLKHAINILLNIGTVVYYFDDIEKKYPEKKLMYLNYKYTV